MDQIAAIGLEILYAIAVLALISAGLAVVFGMMRVINLAHGEFITLGGYATIVSHNMGINIYLAMLVVAPLVAGLFGLIVERLVIRFLYGRLINTMLATWGLSLAMIGGFSMIFGNTTTGVPNPIGGFAIGDYQIGGYSLFVILMAVVVMAGLYGGLYYSKAGLIARAAMQDLNMAEALGQNTSRIYTLTFIAGASLAGLAGGVMAPLLGLNPTSGANYIAKAFITVIAGGNAVVSGTLVGAGLFGTVSQGVTLIFTSVMGELALLLTALLLLRLLPMGLSDYFFRDRT